MAGERKITVAFDGRDVGLGAASTTAVRDLDKVDRSARDAAGGFGALGDGADTSEQRLIGVADTMTGAQDAMAGFGQLARGDVAGGVLTMTMGFADLASGISNLIAPLAGQVTAWVTGRGTMAAADASGAAVHNASWFSMAAASIAGAAQVALAWLISMGPILLVIAAVVALVVVIVKNWDTIKAVIAAGWEFVRQLSASVWNGIRNTVSSVISAVVTFIRGRIDATVDIFRGLGSRLGSALATVASAITAPFRTGFGAIRDIWNSTVGGKGFSVPSWVPSIGGKEFKIPKLATGGLLYGPTLFMGGDNPGASTDPEVVAPLSKLAGLLGGGAVQLTIDTQGSDLDQVLVDVLRKALRVRGGGLSFA